MEGARGVTAVAAIVAVGILILAAGGYVLLRRGNATSQAPAATPATSTSAADTTSGVPVFPALPLPKHFSSSLLDPVDTQMYTNASGAYLKVNNARADSPQAEFVRFDVPDPAALTRVYAPILQAAPNSHPANESTNSNASVTYYTDQQHVYVLSQSQPSSSASVTDNSLVAAESSTTTTTNAASTTEAATLAELVGADPATFQLLGNEYAKDANNVYQIVTTCDASSTCTESLQIINVADPATFQEYVKSIVDQASGSGPVVIDGADVNNVYYEGQVVGSASGNVLQTIRAYGTQEPNGLIWLP